MKREGVCVADGGMPHWRQVASGACYASQDGASTLKTYLATQPEPRRRWCHGRQMIDPAGYGSGWRRKCLSE